MFSILNSPYPCIHDPKQRFYTALLIGIFVAGFLIIFEPFGISESRDSYMDLKSAGFGLVSFLVLLFMYFIVPSIFKNYFKEENYTLGREIFASTVLILLVALGNALYAQFALSEHAFGSIWVMLWQTFIIGIFPLTFLSLLNYSRKLTANLKASEEIKLPNPSIPVSEKTISNPQYFFISGEQEKKQIELHDLLYLESDGNYAYLHQLKDETVTRTMHRTTLKSIEAENTFSNIQRCHRSYIVNLDQVTAVKGNAQGLKLTLQNCEHLVPVSKKYIPIVKKYFS